MGKGLNLVGHNLSCSETKIDESELFNKESDHC